MEVLNAVNPPVINLLEDEYVSVKEENGSTHKNPIVVDTLQYPKEGSRVLPISFDDDDSDDEIEFIGERIGNGGKGDPISVEGYHGGSEVQDALLQFAIHGSLSNHGLDADDPKGKKVMKECIVVMEVVEVPDIEVGESSQSSQKKPEDYCSICMEPKFRYECLDIKGCSHYYCASCVGQYVEAKVEENVSSIRCPDPSCKDGFLDPEMCQKIVKPNVFDRWGSALCEAMIGSMKFYCPFKDCSALLLDEEGGSDGQITQAECPHCCRLFCARCKVPWHSMSCEEYQKLGVDERDREDLMLREMAKSCQWQRCPICKFYVERISGCMFMTCRCGNKFCYGCGTTVTIDHYCTKCKR